jgi:hypothetical protein
MPALVPWFCITYSLFVGLGVGLYALAPAMVAAWFSTFRVSWVAPEALTRALVLVWGGLGLVIFSALLVPRHSPAVRSVRLAWGIARWRLYILSSLTLVGTLALAWPLRQDLVGGIKTLWLDEDLTALLGVRRAATRSYVLTLCVYNLLPFWGVALYLFWRLRRGLGLALYTAIYGLFASVLLLCMAQKRPLLVWLGALAIADLAIRPQVRQRLLLYGACGFGVLLGLYALYSTTSNVPTLAGLALSRLLGRLALPTLFYTHYFPTYAPHYGFANLGLVAWLFGTPLYGDTPEVFSYFTGGREGSVAISSLIDMYGAFGWPGWLLGCLGLGIVLGLLDRWLAHRPATLGTILLHTWTLVAVWYLTQASVARTLLGYGAVWWMLCWALLHVRWR